MHIRNELSVIINSHKLSQVALPINNRVPGVADCGSNVYLKESNVKVYHINNSKRIACELFIHEETVCRHRHLGCDSSLSVTTLVPL